MISIKPGVKLKGLQPQALLGIMVAHETFRKYGVSCVITSVNDSKHMTDSLHYRGQAFDLRIKNVPRENWERVTQFLKDNLGNEFDVILEADHIHVEYDPKS